MIRRQFNKIAFFIEKIVKKHLQLCINMCYYWFCMTAMMCEVADTLGIVGKYISNVSGNLYGASLY